MTEIENQLLSQNINNYIHYFVLSQIYPERFPSYDISTNGIIEDLVNNKDKYLKLFDEIEDEISLCVLDNIIMFRFTFDTGYLIKANEISILDGQAEYFDKEIVSFSSNEVFVDGGAYKGESTKDFIKATNSRFKKVYLFEPDKDLIKDCKKNLKEYKNIEFLQYGLADKNRTVNFKKTNNLDGKIDENGEEEIKICSIDNMVTEPVSYIKLDIEGSESSAIIGARKTISVQSPKLCISAYHYPCDLWKLYNEILNISSNYKVYARHYSNAICDTDFYYIPTK